MKKKKWLYSLKYFLHFLLVSNFLAGCINFNENMNNKREIQETQSESILAIPDTDLDICNGLNDTNKILFNSTRDGNAEVYVMNYDGSCQTNLSNSLEDERFRSWVFSGNSIVYQTGWGWDLYRIDFNETSISTPKALGNIIDDQENSIIKHLSISHSGNLLLIIHENATYLTNTFTQYDLRNEQQIISKRLGPSSLDHIDISYDDKYYVAELIQPKFGEISLGLIGNSTKTDYLTGKNAEGDAREVAGYNPKWSPDNETVSFLIKPSENLYLVQVNINTNVFKIITMLSSIPNMEWIDNDSIIYSDSGYIYIVNSNTKEVVQVTYGNNPSYSKNLNKIAFTRDSEIYTINLDGSELSKLTNNEYEDIYPIWQP